MSAGPKLSMLRELIAQRPFLSTELSLVTGLATTEIRAHLDNDLIRGRVLTIKTPHGLLYHMPGMEPDLVRAQVDYHCAALERLGVLVGVDEV